MIVDIEKVVGEDAVRVFGPKETGVIGLAYDSRMVEPGGVFFCVVGTNRDGHEYIGQALHQQAAAIVGSDEALLKDWSERYSEATFIVVRDVQRTMSHVSASFYKQVYREMHTLAVTGTNGKTTVTSFVHQLLNGAGMKTGSIGTEKVRDDQGAFPMPHTTHTTPEAPDLHRIFDAFRAKGLSAVMLEVTSIAIDQKRVDGLLFDIGILTNLTPEHLDFHASFEQYRESKMTMFRQVKQAVVNLDDDGMAADVIRAFDGPLLTYSLKEDADITGRMLSVHSEGTLTRVSVNGVTMEVMLPVFGAYNISNALAAVGAALLSGLTSKQLKELLPGLHMPDGRLNFLDAGTPFPVITDFAHTPDAIPCVIEAARSLEPDRLFVLIAGNGTRDPSQLPLLASHTEGLADVLVITTEHPDDGDREEILSQVVAGLEDPDHSSVRTALHREAGIACAIEEAREGDLVLLTGLGPLDHQIIHGKEVPYSEIDAVRAAVERIQSLSGACSRGER